MAEKLLTSMVAYLPASGTVCIRSSPEIAGTTPLVTGSIFIAMVPPVAMNCTTGRVCACAWTDVATAARPIVASASVRFSVFMGVLVEVWWWR
ncbi:hypothetical protein D9M68_747710 [compost metagenome]